jgi:hypothetical protein
LVLAAEEAAATSRAISKLPHSAQLKLSPLGLEALQSLAPLPQAAIAAAIHRSVHGSPLTEAGAATVKALPQEREVEVGALTLKVQMLTQPLTLRAEAV